MDQLKEIVINPNYKNLEEKFIFKHKTNDNLTGVLLFSGYISGMNGGRNKISGYPDRGKAFQKLNEYSYVNYSFDSFCEKNHANRQKRCSIEWIPKGSKYMICRNLSCTNDGDEVSCEEYLEISSSSSKIVGDNEEIFSDTVGIPSPWSNKTVIPSNLELDYQVYNKFPKLFTAISVISIISIISSSLKIRKYL